MERRQGRRKRPIREDDLRAIALWHVERWSTTRARLRQSLLRRVEASITEFGGDKEALVAAVDAVVAELAGRGLVSDAAFARSRARTAVRRGVSAAVVSARLSAAGVAREDVKEALADTGENAELRAAAAYVRRRRLGACRPEPDPEESRKDLARLARAGFPFRVAQRALALTAEEVEALAQE